MARRGSDFSGKEGDLSSHPGEHKEPKGASQLP